MLLGGQSWPGEAKRLSEAASVSVLLLHSYMMPRPIYPKGIISWNRGTVTITGNLTTRIYKVVFHLSDSLEAFLLAYSKYGPRGVKKHGQYFIYTIVLRVLYS